MSTIEKLKDDLNELKFTFDTNFCNNKFGGEILTRERTSHSFWSQNGLGAQDILITLGRQRGVNRLQFRLKRRPELVMAMSSAMIALLTWSGVLKPSLVERYKY